MRHLAITGMETVAMISRIFLGEAMRATPPSARICEGTRSSAMTATAPAFSAMEACSALVTSITTPPFSISARPVFRRRLVLLPLFCDMSGLFSAGFGLRLSGSGGAGFYFTACLGFAVPRWGSCRCQLPVKPSTAEGTGSHRVDLIRLAFYMLGEHFFGI